MQTNAKLLEKYRNVNENMRHYGNMRFKELSLFNALNGGLVAGFLATRNLGSRFYIVGITLVVIFALLHERSLRLFANFALF